MQLTAIKLENCNSDLLAEIMYQLHKEIKEHPDHFGITEKDVAGWSVSTQFHFSFQIFTTFNLQVPRQNFLTAAMRMIHAANLHPSILFLIIIIYKFSVTNQEVVVGELATLEHLWDFFYEDNVWEEISHHGWKRSLKGLACALLVAVSIIGGIYNWDKMDTEHRVSYAKIVKTGKANICN